MPETPKMPVTETPGKRRTEGTVTVNTYRVDPLFTHVAVGDVQACLTRCPDRPCAFLCPAGVFDWLADPGHAPIPPPGSAAVALPGPPAGVIPSPLVVRYDRCVECGACRIFCPLENIELDWPRGGFGIMHVYG